MRLIDADALLNILERERKEHEEYGLSQRADGITDAIMDVIDAPTIEPKRMRGKWIKLFAWRYICSKCGDWWTDGKFHYCPNCGADMREGQDEL